MSSSRRHFAVPRRAGDVVAPASMRCTVTSFDYRVRERKKEPVLHAQPAAAGASGAGYEAPALPPTGVRRLNGAAAELPHHQTSVNRQSSRNFPKNPTTILVNRFRRAPTDLPCSACG
jgi:hypothetical protein